MKNPFKNSWIQIQEQWIRIVLPMATKNLIDCAFGYSPPLQKFHQNPSKFLDPPHPSKKLIKNPSSKNS